MSAGARLALQAGLLAAIVLGVAPGCEVDARVLHGEDISGGKRNRGGASSGGASATDQSGSGGTAAAAGRGGSAGTTGGQPTQGGTAGSPDSTAGSGGTGPDPGAECPDLNDNDVLDCEETLIKNPSFDQDESDWAPETDAVLSWDQTDAQTRADSGSLVVENTQAGDGPTIGMVGASQCITVMPGERYALYAETFIEGDPPGGYAGATAWFYDQINCAGQFIEAVTSPLQGTVDTWKVLRIRPIVVPELARSMLVRVAAAKALSAKPLTVRFDNVLLTR